MMFIASVGILKAQRAWQTSVVDGVSLKWRAVERILMPLGAQLVPHVPLLRRFARAVTGDQATGDGLVRATIDRIAASPDLLSRSTDLRLELYRLFLEIAHDGVSGGHGSATDGPERVAQARLARLSPESRQALLLTAMESFSVAEAASLLGRSVDSVQALIAEAVAEIDRQTHADVLIIEDEPMIAMDLEAIVRDLGHSVSAVAMTRSEAVAASHAHRPRLVLADIQLADDSSGIDAVSDILARFSVPVVFITAFPERLLTGDRPEPTYLITKPFQRATVVATIAQALFFDQETMPAS